jgi:hypothetical protein
MRRIAPTAGYLSALLLFAGDVRSQGTRNWTEASQPASLTLQFE